MNPLAGLSAALNRRASERVDRQIEADPLSFIDPSLSGGPIEDILRLPVEVWASHEPAVAWSRSELDACKRHRIMLLIQARWFEDKLQDTVRAEQQMVSITQLKLKAELQVVLEILAAANIDVRVLKGLATGALDYPADNMRQTGDIDLLVRPEDLEAAVKELSPIATTKALLEEIDDPLLMKGIALDSSDGLEIDIHARLGRYWIQDIEPLMAEPVHVETGFCVLNDELRLLHAAGHLLWSPPGYRRLSSLIDMAVLLDRRSVSADSIAAARSIGIASFVGPAFRIDASLRSRAVKCPAWPHASLIERLAFHRKRRALVFEHLLALKNTKGLGPRLRYLQLFLRPGRRLLQHHGGPVRYFGKLIHR